MAKTIKIDPLTRIEGHLAFRVDVEAGQVKAAYCSGEMFRGFEAILRGRHPMDAQQITQRICGVCPISHGIASVLAQDDAYQIQPPMNGRLLRNIVLAGEFLMSHIIHFYHLSILDFVDITAILQYTGRDPQLQVLKGWVQTQLASTSLYPAAPFLPRYEGHYMQETEANILGIKHYLEGLRIRTVCHKMTALFAGKVPHIPTLVPGGFMEQVTVDKIAAYFSMLKDVATFVDQSYLPDILEMAREFPDYWNIGHSGNNLLAYGAFPEAESNLKPFFPSGAIINRKFSSLQETAITEDVRFSMFSSPSGLHPSDGQTLPDAKKPDAYSWIKAPRYNGHVMEVGPAARLIVAYQSDDNPGINALIDQVLSPLGKTPDHLNSVMGRHLARTLECKLLVERCADWVNQLKPNEATFHDFSIPNLGNGAGLSEAARGALGHWIDLEGKKIRNYQCVVPTTWNCSPRDDNNAPGAIERALVGTPVADVENPIEAARVVRSFDPCLACAVH